MRFQLTVLLAAAVLAGCGRKENSPSTPTEVKPRAVSVSDTSANPSPGDTPAPDAPVAPAMDGGGGDIDPATKAAIQKYITKKGTLPRSWIDMTVEQGYLDKIPTGKDGKPLDFDKVMAKLNIKTP